MQVMVASVIPDIVFSHVGHDLLLAHHIAVVVMIVVQVVVCLCVCFSVYPGGAAGPGRRGDFCGFAFEGC